MSSVAKSTAAAARSIIYIGMDVHKESITIAVLPEGAKSPTRLDRLPNDLPKLKKWLERVSRDGEIRAYYERVALAMSFTGQWKSGDTRLRASLHRSFRNDQASSENTTRGMPLT